MKNTDSGKYTYRIEWSQEDGAHVGRCLELPSLSAHGSSAEKALHEIKFLVNETVEIMRRRNEPAPEPFGLRKYKGNLTLRVSQEMHRAIAIRSAEEGVSINQYIISKL